MAALYETVAATAELPSSNCTAAGVDRGGAHRLAERDRDDDPVATPVAPEPGLKPITLGGVVSAATCAVVVNKE